MAAALVEQTYDALMQMIMDGNYKPGDRLPSEMILCNNLQVSRNTLRAALNKLNVLGIYRDSARRRYLHAGGGQFGIPEFLCPGNAYLQYGLAGDHAVPQRHRG